MPDATDEKNSINRKVFSRSRVKQTSTKSAIAYFKKNLTQLASLGAPEIPFEDYVSSDFYNLALLNFFGLIRSSYGRLPSSSRQEAGRKNFLILTF